MLKVRLLYRCVADHVTQLSCEAGDVVVNCRRDPALPGWFYGRLGNKEGWIPENYCKVITDDDEREDEGKRQLEEQQRIAAEEAERQRMLAEQEELDRLAAEEENQRQLAEQEELERLSAEEAERQRLVAEEAERERLAAEEAERQRLVAEEAERERLAAEEAERQRLVAEEAERERVAALEKERELEREAELERIAADEQRAEEERQRQEEEEEQAALLAEAERLEQEEAKEKGSGAAPKRGGSAERRAGRARARGGRGSQAARARGALMRRMSESNPEVPRRARAGPRSSGISRSGSVAGLASALAASRGGAGAAVAAARPAVQIPRSASVGKVGVAAKLESAFGGAPPKKKVQKMVTVYKGLFQFDTSEDNQIAFGVGDIITNVVVSDTGWSSGTIRGKTGWFPSNYAEKAEVAEEVLEAMKDQERRMADIGIEAPEDGLDAGVAQEDRAGPVVVQVSVPDLRQVCSVNTSWESSFASLQVAVMSQLEKKIADHDGYGLYVQPTGIEGTFVDATWHLNTFDLLEDTLEYTKTVRRFTVKVPDGTSLQIDAECTMTVKMALQFVQKQTTFKNADFRLFSGRDHELESLSRLWALDTLQLDLKMPPGKLSLMVKGGGEEVLTIDFSMKVEDAIKMFCEQANVAFSKDLTLTQLGGASLQLKPNLSFVEQRCRPPAACLVKSKTGMVKKIEEKKETAVSEWSEEELAEVKKDIWQEPPDSDATIVFTKSRNADEPPVIQAASLNKLIERLTSAHEHDMKFTRAFLLTYMSFTTPRVLLKKLMDRYMVPDSHAQFRKAIQLRVVNVLRFWMEQSYDDFDHDLTQLLVEFVDNHLMADGFSGPAKKIRQGVLQRTCAQKGAGSVALVFGKRAPLPKIGKEIATFTSVFDFDDEEICRQITLCDFKLYAKVKPSEFLNQSWNKPKLKHKAQNLLGTITRVNRLGMWVALQILEPPKPKVRAKRWTKLIRIAYHLRAYNNFNGLMAFIGGMNNSAVARLKQTRALMSKKNLDIMDELASVMSTNGSYKNFRACLHKLDPPCIPYIGVYLRDLTFMEDGNLDLTEAGLINFEKRRLLFKTISEIQLYQQSRYNLEQVQLIAKFLDPLPSDTTDNLLYDMSIEREARKK